MCQCVADFASQVLKTVGFWKVREKSSSGCWIGFRLGYVSLILAILQLISLANEAWSAWRRIVCQVAYPRTTPCFVFRFVQHPLAGGLSSHVLICNSRYIHRYVQMQKIALLLCIFISAFSAPWLPIVIRTVVLRWGNNQEMQKKVVRIRDSRVLLHPDVFCWRQITAAARNLCSTCALLPQSHHSVFYSHDLFCMPHLN